MNELNTWFYYLLGFYESKNGSIEKSHPVLAEFVKRLEEERGIDVRTS